MIEVWGRTSRTAGAVTIVVLFVKTTSRCRAAPSGRCGFWHVLAHANSSNTSGRDLPHSLTMLHAETSMHFPFLDGYQLVLASTSQDTGSSERAGHVVSCSVQPTMFKGAAGIHGNPKSQKPRL